MQPQQFLPKKKTKYKEITFFKKIKIDKKKLNLLDDFN